MCKATYSNSNRTINVSEIVKEWAYPSHEVPWPNRIWISWVLSDTPAALSDTPHRVSLLLLDFPTITCCYGFPICKHLTVGMIHIALCIKCQLRLREFYSLVTKTKVDSMDALCTPNSCNVYHCYVQMVCCVSGSTGFRKTTLKHSMFVFSSFRILFGLLEKVPHGNKHGERKQVSTGNKFGMSWSLDTRSLTYLLRSTVGTDNIFNGMM